MGNGNYRFDAFDQDDMPVYSNDQEFSIMLTKELNPEHPEEARWFIYRQTDAHHSQPPERLYQTIFHDTYRRSAEPPTDEFDWTACHHGTNPTPFITIHNGTTVTAGSGSQEFPVYGADLIDLID